MVYSGPIDATRRAYIAFLACDKKVSPLLIKEKCNVSVATIYRIRSEGMLAKETRRVKHSGGRPRKLSLRDERNIVRSLKALRKEQGQFSSCRLMQRAGLDTTEVSNRTVRRFGLVGLYFTWMGLAFTIKPILPIKQELPGDVYGGNNQKG